jgi:hypothetical protein
MSPDTPPPPKSPGRLVIPGEPEPAAGGSRIILPPGVSRPVEEEIPEYPRLRPLVLMPISDGQRELLVVTDPLGVIEGQRVLGIEALAILQLLDGTVSLNDLNTALMRESKDLRVANMVRDFVAQLDRLLMLDSPRFEAAYKERREEYHQLEIRPAALDGRSYPAESDELTKFLDGHFAAAAKLRDADGAAATVAGVRPKAILAPHLDPRRAGATIARAYLELGTPAQPLRVVIFGTGHSLIDDKVALTRKHFETPLGKVTCDTAFVDRIAAKMGEAAYHGELAHREEHSIEFQALYLKHVFGERPFTIVPILCGGFHTLLDEHKRPSAEPAMESMIAGVGEAQHALGGDTLYVAGVDFSHVGPRFGDRELDEPMKKEIESFDRKAIDAALTGDPEVWYDAIAAHDDSTRICGFAPTYAMLRCAAPGAGRLLRYEQSNEPDTSVVTVAAMVWE